MIFHNLPGCMLVATFRWKFRWKNEECTLLVCISLMIAVSLECSGGRHVNSCDSNVYSANLSATWTCNINGTFFQHLLWVRTNKGASYLSFFCLSILNRWEEARECLDPQGHKTFVEFLNPPFQHWLPHWHRWSLLRVENHFQFNHMSWTSLFFEVEKVHPQ